MVKRLTFVVVLLGVLLGGSLAVATVADAASDRTVITATADEPEGSYIQTRTTYYEACNKYTGRCVVEICTYYGWSQTPTCRQYVEYKHITGGWARAIDTPPPGREASNHA